jgi:hypothetical protein
MTVLSKLHAPVDLAENDTSSWKTRSVHSSTPIVDGRWKTCFEIATDIEELRVCIDFVFSKNDSCCLEISCRVGFLHQPFLHLTSCSGEVLFDVGDEVCSFTFGTPESGHCPMCSVHMWDIVRHLYDPTYHHDKVKVLKSMGVRLATPESVAVATFWDTNFKMIAVRRFLQTYMPTARFLLRGVCIRSRIPEMSIGRMTRERVEHLEQDASILVDVEVMTGVMSKLNLHPTVYYNARMDAWFTMVELEPIKKSTREYRDVCVTRDNNEHKGPYDERRH